MKILRNLIITPCISLLIISVTACAGIKDRAFLPRNVVQIEDFRLEMKWCSVRPDRTAECEFEMISLYQDKKAGLAYPKIQDERGSEYKLNTGTQPVGGAKMVSGQSYSFKFTASNLPSYVKKVRNVTGIFVAWLPNGSKVLESEVTFANVPVKEIASEEKTDSAIRDNAENTHPPSNLSPLLDFTQPDSWQIVGLWNYDAEDGRYLSGGLVLRAATQKKGWASFLELKKHNSLTPKKRTLWPVKINLHQRKVCANYAGYPTYKGHIDLPGTQHDGDYLFSNCEGESQ